MSDILLRFVHLTDTHINPDPEYTKPYARYTPMVGAEAVIEAINALPFKPEFILHTGDIAYDPVPAVYETVHAMLAKLRSPVYVINGNHDDSKSVQHLLMGRSEDEITPYLYYQFEVKGVQVVCVDSNGDAPVPAGRIPDEILTWLDTLCSADDNRPLIIAVHHNILPVGSTWIDDSMRTLNGEDFHQIVVKARDRIRGVFHGHIHEQQTVYRDGILYSAAPSTWCQFMSYTMPEHAEVIADDAAQPGFNVVTLTAEQTQIRRHTISLLAGG